MQLELLEKRIRNTLFMIYCEPWSPLHRIRH